jgi:hypothetical protein
MDEFVTLARAAVFFVILALIGVVAASFNVPLIDKLLPIGVGIVLSIIFVWFPLSAIYQLLVPRGK